MTFGKSLEQSTNSNQIRCDLLNGQVGTLKGYDCAKCKNKGFIYIIEQPKDYPNGLIVARTCECVHIRESVRALQDSGLAEIVKHYTFDKIETPTDLYKQLKSNALDYVVNGGGKWWFIGGQSGLGKTMLCTAITYELIKKAIPTRYMVWDSELTDIKNQMASNGDFSVKLEEFKRIPLLYIDDLAKFEPTQFEKKIMFEIINYRYVNSLRTIISSERTMAELQQLDEAIGSRVMEKCDKYCYSVKRDKTLNWRNLK